MLIFSRQNLAYFAVPKTGSTAVELALKPKADIIFAKGRKHTPLMRFDAKIAPFLDDAFDLRPERVAVIRDPVEQLSSWYRYRTQAALRGSDNSTAHLSFDQFIADVISDDPPPHAGVGSQFRFLTASTGEVLVHRLFAYERQPAFRGFLEERFEQALDFKSKNVSPQTDTPLEPATRTKLRAARAAEFALYDRLMAADGMLTFTPGAS
ncbi:hypothetical protein [Aestuariivita sp.]|jgi:hypothetical protein|uniref:hypothetical protein n=1 Tax=Aestuariivita sp. TaxID=1872407 RepID=UPI00216BBC77|nr:hypothetical protein [Aestuariivita sp.]MCE8006353.1 hypothetical protein [Aestuariivita sp.]